jgi:hypothetical protein
MRDMRHLRDLLHSHCNNGLSSRTSWRSNKYSNPAYLHACVTFAPQPLKSHLHVQRPPVFKNILHVASLLSNLSPTLHVDDMIAQLVLATLSVFVRLSLAGNICYHPNGDTSDDVPCDLNAPITQCCGTRDTCLSNGLCIIDATNNTGKSYARGTCTDRSWESYLCPQQCQLSHDTPTNRSVYDFRSGGVQVWQCGSEGYGDQGEYCCESEREKLRCCSTESAVFTLMGAVIGPSTAATKFATSLPTPSPGSATPRPTGTDPTESGIVSTTPTASISEVRDKTKTTAIGIGAGVGGAVLCVLIVAAVVCVRRRKHKRQLQAEKPAISELSVDLVKKQPVEVWTQPQEMPSQNFVSELPGR